MQNIAQGEIMPKRMKKINFKVWLIWYVSLENNQFPQSFIGAQEYSD